jgi:large subunit ribosomal protein L13
MKTFSAKAADVSRKGGDRCAGPGVGPGRPKGRQLIARQEKVILTPHVDTVIFVIVINAEKVRLTGKKEEQKSYMSFSGYVVAHKSRMFGPVAFGNPELLIERAVRE